MALYRKTNTSGQASAELLNPNTCYFVQVHRNRNWFSRTVEDHLKDFYFKKKVLCIF